jgi:hypothetical protein
MESKLCQRCAALSLDDTAYSQFQFRDDDGKWLPENPRQFMGNDLGNSCRELPLDYKIIDQLPDLRCLRASAEAGCAFCEALRDATLMMDLKTSGHVTFRFSYLWCTVENEDCGLRYLFVCVEVETTGGKNKSHQSNVLFNVDCEPGKISQWDRRVLLISLKCQG